MPSKALARCGAAPADSPILCIENEVPAATAGRRMPPSYNLGPELAGCGSPPSLKQPAHSLGVPLRFTDLPCRLAGAPTGGAFDSAFADRAYAYRIAPCVVSSDIIAPRPLTILYDSCH